MRSSIDANVASVGHDQILLTCYLPLGDSVTIRVRPDKVPPHLACFGAGVSIRPAPGDPDGYVVEPRNMVPTVGPEITELETWLAALSD